MVKVLFVCMGNICRSPTAEAVFKKMVKEAGLTDKVIVDSAGTHGYHVGEAPDVRAQIAGRKRGYDLSELRARQITSDDFRECDFILAMDWENLTRHAADLPSDVQTQAGAPDALRNRIRHGRGA